MLADQREIGQVVIETNLGDPAGRRVAVVATGAQGASVRIVNRVTLATSTCQRVLVNVHCVTVVAAGIPVSASQGEIGVTSMIELDFCPLGVRVTAVAFGTEAVVMNILDAMAANAING